ncbi:MAG: trigger factor [Chitinophagaceae bacterium]
MATITRENIGLLNDKLVVNISTNDYLPSFEKSLKTYAKSANIAGFRKGMVPTSVVKKMYGQSVFTDEILRTVEKELNEYMKSEQLDIFAQPLPLENDARNLDANNPHDYQFSFEVGLKPEVNIDASNINVTKYKVEVTDKMIDDEINRMQIRNGKMTEPETIESDDNILNLQFEETEEKGNLIEGGINKAISVPLKNFTEDVRKELMKKKQNDNLIIQISKAIDDKQKEKILNDLGLDKINIADADKFFKITISKIGLVEKSELNEELFEAMYPGKEIKTTEEFRNAIKIEIEAYYDAQSRNQMDDQIYHQLVDNTHFDFPENFLKRWLQTSGEKPKTAEEAEKDYPAFVNQLKWSLISTKLIDENNIKVEPDEIKQQAYQQIMSYMGNQNLGDTSWLDEYANRMLKDKKFVEETYFQLQTQKLFGLLQTRVKTIEEPISAENFAEKLHHHHH